MINDAFFCNLLISLEKKPDRAKRNERNRCARSGYPTSSVRAGPHHRDASRGSGSDEATSESVSRRIMRYL